VVVCDGASTDFICELSLVQKDKASARILRCVPNAGEPPIRALLYQSIPRSDKFEYVVQKCVEAGVFEIIPIVSERTQFDGRAKGESGDRLLRRWRRISMEAAKQAGRGIVPEIRGFVPIAAAVSECGRRICESPENRLGIIAYEHENLATLKSRLTRFKRDARNAARGAGTGADTSAGTDADAGADLPIEVSLFIGPEGGFTPSEAESCALANIKRVTLGPRIYRAETAGLAALCQIMYEFEQ
jgi:16S rRNA (uracil1498-N3)-methyltransferase